MPRCDDCGLLLATDGSRQGGDARDRCAACATLVHGDEPIRVSPLQRRDLELVLAWRSNPGTYRYFRDQDGPLQWEDHLEWFRSRGDERHDFVIHYDGRRVGVVSLSEDDEVGILVGDVSARGRGVASAAVTWLCERFRDRAPLLAEVREGNEASAKLFERCGFEREGSDGEWSRYRYVL